MNKTPAIIASVAAAIALIGGQLLATKDGVTARYTQVPPEVRTAAAPTWEFVFRNDTTGELLSKQVSEGEYDAWLNGSMTIPNYPTPKLEGHTWLSAQDRRDNFIVSESRLSKDEFVVLQEPSATTTGRYKIFDGKVETIITEQP